LICAFLLDVEVFDLVGGLVSSNHIQELSQTVSFEVLLRQIFKISLRECNVGLNCDFLIVVAHSHRFAQMSSPSSDFYALAEVLGEVGGIEDFIFDWLGAINGEAV